tara:strand:+ start:2328 stop:2726 length:399 start_codon:yes stop_codon:yes gene_type:complete
MKKILVLLLFFFVAAVAYGHEDKLMDYTKYNEFLKSDHSELDKFLESRKDISPIIKSCFYKRIFSLYEFMTFKEAGWLNTTENNQLIWKMTEPDRIKLYNKYKSLVVYINCLEDEEQRRWKAILHAKGRQNP